MGVSSVALNERGGDNEEDIEPEDESDSYQKEDSGNPSRDKLEINQLEELDESPLLISPDRQPLNSNDQVIAKHEFYPRASHPSEENLSLDGSKQSAKIEE